jgi:hypothetical protein
MADFDTDIALSPVEAPPLDAAITETWFSAEMSAAGPLIARI